MKNFAYTLSEVVICLLIIGIVATLTLPSTIKNYKQNAWATAKELNHKKLIEVTRQMNLDGVMTGVANDSETFMNYFKKYVKTIQICNNNEIKKCYAAKNVNTAEEAVSVDEITTSAALGQKDWNTNTISFVITNGTSIIMAYNPNCKSVDPYSKEGQNGQLSCLAMLIDVNGAKAPNKIGDDIQLLNANISSCDIMLGKLCTAGGDLASIEGINTCDGSEYIQYDDRGSSNIYCEDNYWAGARKGCDDLGMRLPTMQELSDIATYVYHLEKNPLGPHEERSNITRDKKRFAQLGLAEIPSNSNFTTYFSNEAHEKGAYTRDFLNKSTMYGFNGCISGTYTCHARCVEK